MEFKDIEYEVYHKLKDQRNKTEKELTWKQFIEEIDIGLAHIDVYQNYDLYEIIDEKKWALTRLKYGL
jgi:hypothetical protein